jgi:signal transduction histidine kinase
MKRDKPIEILVIEDSPTQAGQLKSMLENSDFKVHVAVNGRLALEYLQGCTPEIVISDIVMPEMDGYELCRRMREDPKLREIPVILVTSLSDPTDVIKGLEVGADNFITKPYDEKSLLSHIQYLITNREMRKKSQSEIGINVFFSGQNYYITAERLQILDLLLSIYENAYTQNRELIAVQKELNGLNERLEEIVHEQTSKLREANEALAREVVERKKAEQKVLKLNEELELRVIDQTTQLEAANKELADFSYSIAHDLRAPLRAMSGFSQALVEDFGDRLEGEALIYLNAIVDGSQHMGQLIDGLLTLSRCTRGELQRDPVNLTEMAERICSELEKIEPQRRVEWRIEPGLSAVGDKRMIEVVMKTLLENAWKYTSGSSEQVIRVYEELENDVRFICVADNGAGFEMAHAGKLFQPFQRLHRQDEFPGIGIGLATAQRIVHRHGGTIHGSGEPGRGATLKFSLPY